MDFIRPELWTRVHSFVFIRRETDNSHSARCDAMQRLKAYTRTALAVDMGSLDPI